MSSEPTTQWTELVQLIMERTSDNSLVWREKETLGDAASAQIINALAKITSPESDAFTTEIDNVTVEFGKRLRSVGSKNYLSYYFRLKNEEGKSLDFFEDRQTTVETYKFKRLFAKVERQVSGADEVVDSLIDRLRRLKT